MIWLNDIAAKLKERFPEIFTFHSFSKISSSLQFTWTQVASACVCGTLASISRLLRITFQGLPKRGFLENEEPTEYFLPASVKRDWEHLAGMGDSRISSIAIQSLVAFSVLLSGIPVCNRHLCCQTSRDVIQPFRRTSYVVTHTQVNG